MEDIMPTFSYEDEARILCPECQGTRKIYLNQFTSRVKIVDCQSCGGTGILEINNIEDLDVITSNKTKKNREVLRKNKV